MGPSTSTTPVVQEGFERACRDFTERIAPLGFRRTRKRLWTRRSTPTLEFVYFHRDGSSYGTPRNFSVSIRVHLGIHVIGEGTRSSLNGPTSDPSTTRAGRYHLRFNAKSWSTYERCIEDLTRFIQEVGEPWFHRFRDPAELEGPDSPLDETARAALRNALTGKPDVANEAASLASFGIKRR